MQAIVVKYIGPSNTRAAKIKATSRAGSIIIPYNHALSIDVQEADAAARLCAKLEWSGDLACAMLPNGDTVFVFKDEQ